MSLQVNFVVLFVAIKIVVRRATYKVKPAERGVMSDLQVEIRYQSFIFIVFAVASTPSIFETARRRSFSLSQLSTRGLFTS